MIADNHNPVVTVLPAPDGYEAHQLSGRVRVSIWLKLCPWWWTLNTLEPSAPDWYLPSEANWRRQIKWWCRNPMDSLFSYVLGVKDYDYVIRGKSPLDAGTPADAGLTGFKWSVIEMPIGLRWGVAVAALIMTVALAWIAASAASVIVSAALLAYFLPFAVLRLPAVSYAGHRVLWYIGWQWEGQLGAKLVLRKSSVQGF